MTSSFVDVPDRPSAEARARPKGDAADVARDIARLESPPVRVLIVDADRRVRRDLAELLELEPRSVVVGTAGDPAAALAMTASLAPDVVVLDPRLPDVDAGLGLIAQLHRESTARIVVLCHDPEFASRATIVGADRFVTKGERLPELLGAIAGSGPPDRAPGQGGDGDA
jgi:CheY-like chemotaxis protein